MVLQHLRRGSLQLLRVAREVGPRAAPVLRGVARQFHAVYREYLAADQLVLVRQREDRGEDARDIVAWV